MLALPRHLDLANTTPRLALLAGRAVGETVIVAWGTAMTAAMGFPVGFRLHGSMTEALLAFTLCVGCGFAFLWIFICIGRRADHHWQLGLSVTIPFDLSRK